MTGADSAASKTAKPTYHYGRGGAGNVTTKARDGINEDEMKTPTLKAKMWAEAAPATWRETTTLMRLARPKMSRLLMLAYQKDRTTPDEACGAANLYKPNDAERLEAREYNERIRRESFKSSSRERPQGLKAAVATKGKEQ
ncbi:hypothetical protein DV735_g1252, partial [Chaetothyriales sp. CBS 134920]